MIQTMPARWAPGIRSGHPLARGLVAAYAWLDGKNPAWRNIVEDKVHMTAFNAPTVVPSEMGRAVLFDDGSSQYLGCATTPVIEAPLTLACWTNIDDISSSRYAMAIRHSGDTDILFFLGVSSTGNLAFAATKAGSGQQSSASSTLGIATNAWHHVCAVFAAADDRRAYLDGGNKGTEGTSRVPTGLDSLSLGATNAGFMSGLIAFPCIWNRALTDLEVKWLYDEPWSLITPRRRTYFFLPFTIPRFVHYYRQRRTA